ncbi:DUF2288 domain-containing protein [Undibacterium sp. FT79W]|uniref:DUF2288 domain-containing protein n=1 Tax=Undibacterium sp. FT79W TaxID=2762296 RepID=UPI00164AD37F|nr:DUF2288 domain-containing protein [Undibacterium sp. FT79W]MBC3877387.1 DUF2288 domain-containing protein [Undibacterium sp. FT79W]
MSSTTDPLRTKINQETALFPWSELLKHFASGNVLAIAPDLDLVEIALHMANDNAAEIQSLLSTGRLYKVSDEQAKVWLENELELWTVVVKPWILVQHRPS